MAKEAIDFEIKSSKMQFVEVELGNRRLPVRRGVSLGGSEALMMMAFGFSGPKLPDAKNAKAQSSPSKPSAPCSSVAPFAPFALLRPKSCPQQAPSPEPAR